MRLKTIVKYGGIAAVGATVYAKLVRPWHLAWGTTEDEAKAVLPGDEFAPEPTIEATHAITIDAPPEDVWPWIAQLGQHKAGFYSYRWLEDLAGCHMPGVDHVVAEWQDIKPGHKVWLHPKVALEVLIVEPGRTLVLSRDWSFHLRPLDDGRRTRLIVRNRGYFENPNPKTGEAAPFDLGPLGNLLYWRMFFEPGHFIMERKMMLGIKKRAEDLAEEREAARLIGVA
jgi:uncharacterized protein YndB with AHSA1/START domain